MVTLNDIGQEDEPRSTWEVGNAEDLESEQETMDRVSLVSRAMEIHISLLPSYGDFGRTNFAHLKWNEMSQFGQMRQTKISNSHDCTISKACQSHAFEVRSTRLNSWEVRLGQGDFICSRAPHAPRLRKVCW